MQYESKRVNRESFPKGVTHSSRSFQQGVNSARDKSPQEQAPQFDQIALNSSNGWRHEQQNQIDLHAVDPNSLLRSVSIDLQKGQRTRRARRSREMSSARSARPGGAIPYASSFAFAAGPIQSVVHAGA